MKILLFGKNGQIGTSLVNLSKNKNWPIGFTLIDCGRPEVSYENEEQVTAILESANPDIIINAVAYTAVDRAESDRELCEKLNINFVGSLINYCKKNSCKLIHFSSDYVYSGIGSEPHTEDEVMAPLNFYGLTKAEADQLILDSKIDTLIFRTSWVFSSFGKNFVTTLLKLAQEKNNFSVVSDQYGSPSYAPDLALYTLDIMIKSLKIEIDTGLFPSGVYHLTNSGFTNWSNFARAFLKDALITDIKTLDYKSAAIRPLNSRLSLDKIKQNFNLEPRSWNEALDDCLKGLHENQ